MKIIVVGGTGTIGKAVVNELTSRHEMVVVGNKHGELQVDITDPKSIKKMYQQIGKFDALISATGNLTFAPLEKMDDDAFQVGLKSKLMGQVNLILLGMNQINDKGSFTLTSGILSHDPIRFGASASMVNAALDGFVIGASIEMPRNIRINSVSPTVITESLDKYAEYFRGYHSVPAKLAAQAYSKSVEGAQTGQIYRVN